VAQRGVVRHSQSESEQVDDGTDQPLGLSQRQAEHGPERQRRQDRQRGIRPVRLSGTVYCHKAELAALDVLRQRWMVAGWMLKVLATSLMDLPSSTSDRASVF